MPFALIIRSELLYFTQYCTTLGLGGVTGQALGLLGC